VVIVALCSAAVGPCRGVAPIIDDIAVDLSGVARVLAIDVDSNPAVMQRYEVSSLPTLLVFRGGRLLARLVGGRSRDRLLTELSAYLD
jgi:thioredoxin 1